MSSGTVIWVTVMRAMRSARAWPRRRVVATLAALLGVGVVIAWQMRHQHDPRLVGTWKTPNGTLPAPIETWTFHADGTGRELWTMQYSATSHKGNGFAPFRWWTAGDRLFVRRGSRSTTFISLLLESVDDAVYRRRRRTDEYECAIDGDRLSLRLLTGNWPRPLELRRAPE